MKRTISLFLALVLCACGKKTEHTAWQEQYDLGVRYLSEGKYEEAILAFAAAIEIDPKREEAYLAMADVYMEQGDYEQAQAVLTQALSAVLNVSVVTEKLALVEALSEPSAEQNPGTESGLGFAQETAVKGVISLGGSGRDMTVSLTWPGLPEVCYTNAERWNDAGFEVLFSDGKNTFYVITSVEADESFEGTVAIPDGDKCYNRLFIQTEGSDYSSSATGVYTTVETVRNGDMLTWNFQLPEGTFTVSEVRYVGYEVSYLEADGTLVWDHGATFTVENGEMTFFSDKSLLYMGFFTAEEQQEPWAEENVWEPDPEGISIWVNSQAELDALPSHTDAARIISVDASCADISDITALSKLQNLEKLDLDANSVSDISALSWLPNLEVLHLLGNGISDISVLSGLTNLKSLELRYNNISDISALSGLTNLQFLYLDNNNISDIRMLSGLVNLMQLWLRENDLTQEQIDELQAKLPNCDFD